MNAKDIIVEGFGEEFVKENPWIEDCVQLEDESGNILGYCSSEYLECLRNHPEVIKHLKEN